VNRTTTNSQRRITDISASREYIYLILYNLSDIFTSTTRKEEFE
jgi:hypothetical protein